MTQTEINRRQHILDAAERLIQHYGPNKTTMAEVAREADLGVGTVYLEFPSKEAILEELSSRCHASVLTAMRAAAADGARFERRLRAVLDARLDAFLGVAEKGSHARDLVHCSCPGVRVAHETFAASERALLADLLQAAARAREFTVADPQLAARALIRAYASFAPPWLFAQPADETRALHEAMHGLVLRGLLRRPATARRPR